MSGEITNIELRSTVDQRLLAALSRFTSAFVHNGRPGAKVILPTRYTKVCQLAPEVEQEVQDCRILLTSYGRPLE